MKKTGRNAGFFVVYKLYIKSKEGDILIKKSIRLLLVGVLLTVFAAGGALASAKFNDVGDYWATEAIKWAAEKGVVEGYPDGTFRPTNYVTEAEFAAILARYVVNTDKDFISQRQPGKHWAQSIYDELRRWELPLNGYTNDIIKDTVITRGDVARVIAAKNGFNLDERQAVYYMYENDLSNGMIPNRMTFDSYGADQPLQRDQITQFMKLLNSKGYTTFLGEPSPKGNAGPADIIGIVDVPKSDAEITDDMFDELAKEKGIENPKMSEWEKLAKSGGITSESQLTPEVVEIVREKGVDFPRDDWKVLDNDKDYEGYKKAIEYDLRNVAKVGNVPIVVSRNLFCESNDWVKHKNFIVIVNGRQSWIVNVGKLGNEYRVYDAGVLVEDIFKN